MILMMMNALAGSLSVEWTPEGAEQPVVLQLDGVQEHVPQRVGWEVDRRHSTTLEVEVLRYEDGVALIRAEVKERRDPWFSEEVVTTAWSPTFKLRVGEEGSVSVHDGRGGSTTLALTLEDADRMGEELDRDAERVRRATRHRRAREERG